MQLISIIYCIHLRTVDYFAMCCWNSGEESGIVTWLYKLLLDTLNRLSMTRDFNYHQMGGI